jgi:hypothetical protein
MLARRFPLPVISRLEINASILRLTTDGVTAMIRLFFAALTAVSLAFTSVAITPAYAGGGDVAAGLIGGLAAGTIIGAAVASPRYYAPPPVYVTPGPSCYWTRGAPVWDGYRGLWVYPSVQVCE